MFLIFDYKTKQALFKFSLTNIDMGMLCISRHKCKQRKLKLVHGLKYLISFGYILSLTVIETKSATLQFGHTVCVKPTGTIMHHDQSPKGSRKMSLV